MRFPNYKFCLGVLLFFLVGGFTTPAAAQAPVPRFEPGECPFAIPPDETITCGMLWVPEDHAHPSAPTIQIAVAIVHSHSTAPAPDPVVFLNGGPGGHTLRLAPLLLSYFAPFLQTRDVILFDQRGVGFSQPALECPELDTLITTAAQRTMSQAEFTTLTLDVFAACRARLTAQGVNLAAYTSAQNAADVEALRLALGYAEWNLLGISYGTRLGLTVLRHYPQGVRSLILDSTAPPNASLYLEAVANADRAFNVLFDGCAADWGCNWAYPQLETVFYALVAELDAHPAAVPLTLPESGETFTVSVTGYQLTEVTFNALYNARGIAQLPQLIYNARDGDYRLLGAVLQSFLQLSNSISTGMAFSVQCTEEVPFFSLAQLQAARQGYPPALAAYASRRLLLSELSLQLCPNWVAASPDPQLQKPVQSEVPTLILAGQYDPVTPPAWGELAAATLPKSYFYTLPATGHGTLQAGACPLTLMLAFVQQPTQAPEAGCVARMDASPDFVIRAEAVVGPFWLLLPVLSVGVGWAVGQAGQTLRRRRWPFAWWHSGQRAGWWPLGLSAGLIALLLYTDAPNGVLPLNRFRVIETLVPLIAGMQAAWLFSPDDEPGLEMLLTCPRPLAWTVLERVAVVVAGHGLIALLASGVATAFTGEALGAAILRWLAPLLFFVGVGLCLTLITRQAIFSAALLILLWFGMAWAGETLLLRWPFLWPLSLYLAPTHPFFWLNRVGVLLLGLNLLVFATGYLLHDTERILSGRAAARGTKAPRQR